MEEEVGEEEVGSCERLISRQEYKEMSRKAQTEVAKAKEKAYGELYERLDTREGEKDFYRSARQIELGRMCSRSG